MDNHEKFIETKKRAEENNVRKIRAEERFKAAKVAVANVVTEVKEAGYDDPKKLPEALKALETEFADKLSEVSSLLDEQDAILKSIEG